ncbi:hypothetical protein ACOME3_004504 [Neoechinorhynchus agilis]
MDATSPTSPRMHPSHVHLLHSGARGPKNMDGSFGSYYGDLHQYVILSLGILYGITGISQRCRASTVASPCLAVI